MKVYNSANKTHYLCMYFPLLSRIYQAHKILLHCGKHISPTPSTPPRLIKGIKGWFCLLKHNRTKLAVVIEVANCVCRINWLSYMIQVLQLYKIIHFLCKAYCEITKLQSVGDCHWLNSHHAPYCKVRLVPCLKHFIWNHVYIIEQIFKCKFLLLTDCFQKHRTNLIWLWIAPNELYLHRIELRLV